MTFTHQNQSSILRNSQLAPDTAWFAFNSEIEYWPVPHMSSSSSFSSKMASKLSGMRSFRPFRKCSTSSLTELASLCCASASAITTFH